MIAWQKENWFWPLAVVLVLVAMLISKMTSPQPDNMWEVAVIFDVLITLPVLFALCFRKKLSLSKLAIRVIALQCLGIWLATKIVPLNSQVLLPQLSWLRYLGLGVLALLELKLIFILLKIVSKPGTTAAQLEAACMPPFIAKLMLIEARFWRWVFSIIKK